MLLTLPLPPSVNACWANIPGKGRARTVAYRDWINVAGWEAKTQMMGHQTITGPYRLKIEVSAPRFDIDNVIKQTGDFLQSMSIVSNDRNMVRLVVERCDGPRGIRIEVEAVEAAGASKEAA